MDMSPLDRAKRMAQAAALYADGVPLHRIKQRLAISQKDLKQAVADLPPLARGKRPGHSIAYKVRHEVLALSERYTLKEIGEKLDISPATARTALQLAKEEDLLNEINKL